MHVRLLSLLVVAVLCSATLALPPGDEAGTALAANPADVAAQPGPAARLPACPIPARHRTAFEVAARNARLPLALLVAVAEVESGFHAAAVSPAGARGLLQLMPGTAAELAVDADLPAANVLGGARYLRAQLDRFGSTDLALSAYNAGPTVVARTGGAPSGETLTYVANVTARWRTLVGCR